MAERYGKLDEVKSMLHLIILVDAPCAKKSCMKIGLGRQWLV